MEWYLQPEGTTPIKREKPIMPETVLKIEHISKKFPGVQALDDIVLTINKGEIHAIVGENGAGKSTLMKILSGVIEKDSGTIVFQGNEIVEADPRVSQQLGISIVYQELALARNLTVMDNVFLWQLPSTKIGLVSTKDLYNRTKTILESLGVDFSPDALVKDLTISQRQIVEIAKALSMNASLIIMDEPNSALSPSDTEFLFQIIQNLKTRGVTVLFISHRLDEVFHIADRITILRDGKFIGTKIKVDTDVDEIISMMVGREYKESLYDHIPSRNKEISSESLLRIENISNGKNIKDVSFELHKQEILGISGLVGAGRTDLAEMLFGLQPVIQGKVWLEDQEIKINHPIQALNLGIAFLPEDRKLSGLFLNMSVADNINIASYKKLSSFGIINTKNAISHADKYVSRLNIRISELSQKIMSLSGGNQQKAILARWLAISPKILILDEPTRGIDVGAKAQIYELINELSERGIGIILISSELEEVMAHSDRILVMRRGNLTAEFNRDEVTSDEIIKFAA